MNRLPTLLRFASRQIKYPVVYNSNYYLFEQWNSIRYISSTTPLFAKTIVPLPALGDSVSDGTIVNWTKKIGDNVKADEVIAVIETDKVLNLL